ncbi:glycosyltransferase family 2 protein [Mucilaginibacter sp.]|uniref:glycosyltransferase family 2 protein n=1 Tax=Mucilaginibacter sp. TaxID=1882438 RepID=UPI0025FB38D0|nr:glycosyltransferase family 2 protein [Mucilaginibacter sp.]
MASLGETILTIAIPTYNRAVFLNKALNSIQTQLIGYEDLVEIIVSDNCSTDNTAETVTAFIDNGVNVRYIINAANIGADLNIAQCFLEAHSKFVLILGDDDFFLAGAIEKIIAIIQNKGDAGIIFVNGASYNDKFEVIKTPSSQDGSFDVYHNKSDFVKRVNYYLTFISGNIIKKELVDKDVNLDDFKKTNLIQLGWVIPAFINSPYNVVVEENLLGIGSVENTGGYKLFDVFGEKFNLIMKAFIAKGFNQKYINIVNNSLIISFFPPFLVMNKSAANGRLVSEDPSPVLYSNFKKYGAFWVALFPILLLPRQFCRFGIAGSMLLKKMTDVRSILFARLNKNTIRIEKGYYSYQSK